MLSIRPVVVSYRNSTSNHNYGPDYWCPRSLYLIEILHQTTTGGIDGEPLNSCILSKFYIKPQRSLRLTAIPLVVSYRNSTSNHNSSSSAGSSLTLYLIEILHQTTTFGYRRLTLSGCILSKFYIKPQRLRRCPSWASGCILSKFYIKPQRLAPSRLLCFCCILSKFYIKPQLYFWSGVTPDCCILSKFYIKPQR